MTAQDLRTHIARGYETVFFSTRTKKVKAVKFAREMVQKYYHWRV